MSFAHVESVDALKELRNALWKFTEAANQCLSESDADLQRTLSWLEHDARIFWQGQIRQRTLALNQAKESLRSKQSISRRDGSKPSAIEELKAVAVATARVQHAEEKLEKVKQYAKVFQREALQYRGLMQRFVNTVQVEVPEAAGHLDGLIDSLTQYTAPEEVGSTTATAGPSPPAGSMKRPEEMEPVKAAIAPPPDSQGPVTGETATPPEPEPAKNATDSQMSPGEAEASDSPGRR